MKERKFLPADTAKRIITAAYVLAVILSFLAAVFAVSYDSSRNNGSEYAFNDGWLYEDDEKNLMPFSAFGKKLDDREVVLIHPHDESIDAVDAIGFYNYYSAAEVYVGDQLIYRYGSVDDLENGVLLGNFFSMVDIHGHHMQPENVKVIFRSTQPQTVYGFRAGSGAALEMAVHGHFLEAEQPHGGHVQQDLGRRVPVRQDAQHPDRQEYGRIHPAQCSRGGGNTFPLRPLRPRLGTQ